jgi:cyclopropane-fatty-acyl-phospholipid synthase
MGLYLAREAGVSVKGITLSDQQLSIANERAAQMGLQNKAKFELVDYRDETEKFDRIVSVGMFEHVGIANYDTFFAQAYNLLKDDGVMLLHTIGRMDGPGPTSPWISKYIFPGGYSPALSEVMESIERQKLFVTDVEIWRLHYAKTLQEWRRRFHQDWNKARDLQGERFCRMWDFYLAACQASFEYDSSVVFQIQLTKRRDAVPLTRDYIEKWKKDHPVSVEKSSVHYLSSHPSREFKKKSFSG